MEQYMTNASQDPQQQLEEMIAAQKCLKYKSSNSVNLQNKMH
jgi:hypothetical protein